MPLILASTNGAGAVGISLGELLRWGGSMAHANHLWSNSEGNERLVRSVPLTWLSSHWTPQKGLPDPASRGWTNQGLSHTGEQVAQLTLIPGALELKAEVGNEASSTFLMAWWPRVNSFLGHQYWHLENRGKRPCSSSPAIKLFPLPRRIHTHTHKSGNASSSVSMECLHLTILFILLLYVYATSLPKESCLFSLILWIHWRNLCQNKCKKPGCNNLERKLQKRRTARAQALMFAAVLPLSFQTIWGNHPIGSTARSNRCNFTTSSSVVLADLKQGI